MSLKTFDTSTSDTVTLSLRMSMSMCARPEVTIRHAFRLPAAERRSASGHVRSLLPLLGRCWYTPVPTPLSVTVGTVTYRNRCTNSAY